jgi:hypothetical protein
MIVQGVFLKAMPTADVATLPLKPDRGLSVATWLFRRRMEQGRG